MTDIAKILSRTKIQYKLQEAMKTKNSPILLSDIGDIQGAIMAVLACKNNNQNIIIVTKNEIEGNILLNDLNAILGKEDIVTIFKSREMVLRNIEVSSNEYEHLRLSTICKILDVSSIKSDFKVLIVPADALISSVMPVGLFKKLTFKLSIGQREDINDIAQKLINIGYTKSCQVDGVGQFSIRGEIFDIYPPNSDYPVRIDFWDNEIDNMFLFDVVSQRRKEEKIDSIFISQVKEVLIENPNDIIDELNNLLKKITNKKIAKQIQEDILKINTQILPDNIDKYLTIIYKEKTTILDYLPDAPIFIMDINGIIESIKSIWWQYSQDIELLIEEEIINKNFGEYIFTWNHIENELSKKMVIFTNPFNQLVSGGDTKEIIKGYASELSPWNGKIDFLKSELKFYKDQNYNIIVLTGIEKITNNLMDDLKDKGFNVSRSYDFDYNHQQIIISNYFLSSAFEFRLDKLVFISINKNYNIKEKIKKRKHNSIEMAITNLEDISIGDYLVHVNHGIGIFDGINTININGVIKDYLKIKYKGSDVLYVPVTQLDLVAKYIGNKEDGIICVNKLSSNEWQKKRSQVKAAVKDIAKDLIKLQSERINSKGYQFSQDTDWQHQFEDLFEYEPTDAQLRCIAEIKNDMQKPYPMDRLLCGDVGVGKTEVAVRVAFKAVMDSKQVAILVPTTILAWQHYNTIINRLGDFPIEVELLSRLRGSKEQKNILQRLKTGEIEIIVGTHKILQKDIEFKDLGLIIIDEEQRFGVLHKERFKKIKHNVDILTLSATPIPRTLNMAMSGLKDMSILDEYPQDRLPIQTYVLEYDENIISSAIIKEMRRSGMVFYLYNRIENIDDVVIKIAKLVKGARIFVAHGRMNQNELTAIWQKILDHEVDILVCTTIIETGIDVQFCNTLIVENADTMGLSQLHQLRGRIGRSNQRAYAYMTFRKGKNLSEISCKRLEAIKEYTKFGSGFKIAMRDLEIRGAGNILGSQQHGHIDSVGYDMYLKLLSEAVVEEKGDKIESLTSEQCIIDINASAYLPEKYVSDISNRINIYKKIALIKTKDDYDNLVDELVDRFGEPTQEVMALLNISFSKNMAIKHRIKEISQKGNELYLYIDDAYTDFLSSEFVGKLSGKYKHRMALNMQDNYIKIEINKGEGVLNLLKNVLLV